MQGPVAGSVVALLLLALAAAPTTAQQAESRQTFELAFTTQRTDSPTGFSEAIDYVNPDDPGAKPRAVQKVVLRLAPGAEIDTSVPDQCDAPDPVLIVQGASACPNASVVGGGRVDLDTGLPGPARIVRNDVTLLNDEGQLIFLFEEEGSGGRAVSRAEVSGNTFTTEVPPIPGGPPDGFTAIDRVVLDVKPVSNGRRTGGDGYITTPGWCPKGGEWINTAIFSYRDGVTQTVESATPCRGRRAERMTAGTRRSVDDVIKSLSEPRICFGGRHGGQARPNHSEVALSVSSKSSSATTVATSPWVSTPRWRPLAICALISSSSASSGLDIGRVPTSCYRLCAGRAEGRGGHPHERLWLQQRTAGSARHPCSPRSPSKVLSDPRSLLRGRSDWTPFDVGLTAAG